MNEKDRNSLLTPKAKIILALNLVAILILWSFILVNAQEGLPENPKCESPWFLLWEFENSSHCGGGVYRIYYCTGNVFSEIFGWYKTIVAYTATCDSSIKNEEIFFNYLPMVIK